MTAITGNGVQIRRLFNNNVKQAEKGTTFPEKKGRYKKETKMKVSQSVSELVRRSCKETRKRTTRRESTFATCCLCQVFGFIREIAYCTIKTCVKLTHAIQKRAEATCTMLHMSGSMRLVYLFVIWDEVAIDL